MSLELHGGRELPGGQAEVPRRDHELVHLHHTRYPDTMGSLDSCLDPDSQSGSRRAKMTHKHRKKIINFIF